MSATRDDVLDWMQEGRLKRDALPAALRIAGITPTRSNWMDFLDRLTLWLGVVFLAAALIFFFAYNWQDMGRYAKFGLVEVPMAACLVLCWKLGVERIAGKAVLLLIALLTGALLALVGQIYQTGADTFELFAVWALAVLPLVAVGCFSALWLFWIALLNVALALYFNTFGIVFGVIFSGEKLLWTLFVFNTLALCIWEGAAQLGVQWLQERWPVRVLALASGGVVMALAVWAIVDDHAARVAAAPAYLGWMTTAYFVYRRWRRDLFVLAGGVLSAIIVVAVFLADKLLRHDSGGGWLLIGMVVIGLSAAGGIWLKSIAKEERT
jgi:uncharacterized membrane protein